MTQLADSIETEPLSSAQRILNAAHELFFEHGFGAVSTARLAEAANVSKSTIYKYFGDMTGVLEAVVKKEGDSFQIERAAIPEARAAYWQGLYNYGLSLLQLMNRKDIIQFEQMMHEEARHHPELGQRFYKVSFGRSHEDMTTYIAKGIELGFIDKPYPAEQLADHLISMWEGLSLVRTRLAVQEKPFDDPNGQAATVIEVLFGISLVDEIGLS